MHYHILVSWPSKDGIHAPHRTWHFLDEEQATLFKIKEGDKVLMSITDESIQESKARINSMVTRTVYTDDILQEYDRTFTNAVSNSQTLSLRERRTMVESGYFWDKKR